jgi:hypothetical protein
MISILITLAIFGFIVYLITLVPMPAPWKNVIIGVAILFLVIYVLQMLGGVGGFPRLHL